MSFPQLLFIELLILQIVIIRALVIFGDGFFSAFWLTFLCLLLATYEVDKLDLRPHVELGILQKAEWWQQTNRLFWHRFNYIYLKDFTAGQSVRDSCLADLLLLDQSYIAHVWIDEARITAVHIEVFLQVVQHWSYVCVASGSNRCLSAGKIRQLELRYWQNCLKRSSHKIYDPLMYRKRLKLTLLVVCWYFHYSLLLFTTPKLPFKACQRGNPAGIIPDYSAVPTPESYKNGVDGRKLDLRSVKAINPGRCKSHEYSIVQIVNFMALFKFDDRHLHHRYQPVQQPLPFCACCRM